MYGCNGEGDNNKKESEKTSSIKKSVVSLDDPFYKYQWHLYNRGQSTPASTLPTPNIDLNVSNLHDKGFRGQNVVVAVVDEGVQLDHEDLVS